MEVKVYNQKGKEAGTLELKEKIFTLPWNANLVFEVVEAERSNARKNTAHTKDRAEVRGGGKKPWAQKGTGRARHGSSRSPLWIGGGTTHGPRVDRNFIKKINKKARRKALGIILAEKLREGEIIFLDSLEFSEMKTRHGAEMLKNLSKIKGLKTMSGKSKVLVLLPSVGRATYRALRNLENVEVKEARNVAPLDLLSHKFILLPKEGSKILAETFHFN